MTISAGSASVATEILPTMGTVASFDVVVDTEALAHFHIAMASVRARLQRLESIFSLWISDSPMSRIRGGRLAIADAPTEVSEVLRLCRECRDLTDGWFEVEALPGGIDPTGLVKGWATEQAAECLRLAGFTDFLINVGGDVTASGGPATAANWRIGIADPRAPLRLLGVVELEGSLATSGSYERGQHLYDPRRERYCSSVASASVAGPSLAVADAMATALAVAGNGGLTFVDEADGYEALICGYDGEVNQTAGFALVRTGSESRPTPFSHSIG